MELLIRIVDKCSDPDPEKGIGYSRAGNVIAACPDGWQWSQMEIENPAWRVVRVNLTDVEKTALTTPAYGDIQVMPIPFRKFFIDFDKLPPDIKQEVIDTPYDIVDITEYTNDFRNSIMIRE
jgi:hypothetical protein